MATIYRCFHESIATGAIDLESDTNIYAVFVSGSYVPNVTGDTNYLTHVAPNESVDGNSNYTAGGYLVTGTEVTADGVESKFDASDITIANTSMTASGVVLYYSGMADNNLICHLAFDSEATSTNGDFSVAWAATGILRFRQGA